MIKLLGKRMDIDNMPVLYKNDFTQESFERDFEVRAGKWHVEDGWLVGENPNILALPRAFTTAAVHLCMKNPAENSHFRDDAPAHPCGG